MLFLFHFLQFIAFIPLRLLYPTKIVGRKNLPKGKCVLSVNHTSSMDAALLAGYLFEKKYFLAKEELFKHPVRRGFMKILGGIPINRENPSLASIKKSLGVLKENKKLVVFPEGTRHKDKVDKGELGETKNGVAMFAIKGKAPIVPVWINRKPRMFRRTIIEIGNAYELSEFYDKKLDEPTLKEAGQIMSQKILEIGKRHTNGKVWH